MRIAELSRRSGISVPTIKYYLREGLLPPGEPTSRNQAHYDEGHLRRLQLVRTLLEIGRLPIATIKEILSDLDQPEPDLPCALGRALTSTGPSNGVVTPPEIDELIMRRGWTISDDAPARRAAADVVSALRRLGWNDLIDRLDEYAAAADQIAQVDLDIIGRRERPEEILYGAVVGTILGDALIAALRRLAHESMSHRIYGKALDGALADLAELEGVNGAGVTAGGRNARGPAREAAGPV